MANWKKVLVSGSAIDVRTITASGIPQLSDGNSANFIVVDSDGRFFTTGSGGGGGGGIFQSQDGGAYYNTENVIQISASEGNLQPSPGVGTGTADVNTGDGNAIYSVLLSESLYAYNHNTGFPQANAWKTNLEGSYFNNFDANTNVSEILRFIAGLLSSSAPSSTPNTREYDSLSGTSAGNATGNNPKGRVPKNATNTIITYLEGKGFAEDGVDIFDNIGTIYRQSTFNRSFESNVGSTTTTVSSDAGDTQLFGLGALDGDFVVSASYFFKFADSSTKTPTIESSSGYLITLDGSAPESSLGAEKNKINTATPAVIPAEFQDGKFDLTRTAPINFNTSPDLTAKEGIGYYQISASVGIRTGSVAGNQFTDSAKENKIEIFYSPLYDGSTMDDSIGEQTITHEVNSSSLNATFNKLSGAPYLIRAQWTVQATSSGVFNPMYSEDGEIWRTTESEGTISGWSVAQDITTSGLNEGKISGTSYVYSNDLSTQRASVTVPEEDDKLYVSRTVTFAPGTANSIAESSIDDSDFTLSVQAKKRKSTTYNANSDFTIEFHKAGTFSQPAASGSAGYHDPGQHMSGLSKVNEYFTTEFYRVQLNGSNIDTTTDLDLGTSANRFNSGSDLVIGGASSTPSAAQVKPGFLVAPGSSNGYWHGSDYFNASRKYWYIREFDTDAASAINQFDITFNGIQTADIVDWDAAANGKISLGIIFESDIDKLIDINQSDDNVGIGDTATDATNNPFSNNIDIRGNTGRVITGTSNPTYTVKVNAGQNLFLNASNQKFWLVVRYVGNCDPITSITTNL